ncbi:MAG: tetratricopeptide repeat protein [Acidobacteriaceae bacterium]
MKLRDFGIVAALSAGVMAAPLQGQGFGMAKTKVTLERKLPALIQLPGDTIRVKVTGHQDQTDLAHDLQALLETELLKDNPQLREDEDHPAVTVYCQIINFTHPQPTVTRAPAVGKAAPQVYTRITGALSVSFQAKTSAGRTLGSYNIDVNYDQEFDSNGNNASHGVMGGLSSGWHKIKGSSSTDQDDSPPTDAELRSRLLMMAVNRVAEHIVNTDESIDVFLAKNKGALDEGDKQAEAGLWERALETFETADPLTKHDDDAYRLYNIGVADEALGYQAKDTKTAMKFLDQAAIDYGKAIDAKPGEKYFLIPQKRIETALMHYHKLEEQKNAPVVAENTPPPPVPPPADPPAAHTVAAPAVSHHSSVTTPRTGTVHSRSETARALTNAQIIAMVKAGVSDDIVAASVRNAKAVDFDLSLAARRHLTESGVSPEVLEAMKMRWAHELTSGK